MPIAGRNATIYKGKNIGTFLSNIKHHTTSITDKQKSRLLFLKPNALNIQKRKDKNQTFELLIEYIEETGVLPKKGTQYKRENIGQFLSHIKRGNTSITKEQRKRLLELCPDALDIKEKKEKKDKNKTFELLIVYIKETGTLPKQRTQYEGENMGQFLSNIKRGQTSITQKQLNELLKYIPDLSTEKIKIKEEKKVKSVKNLKSNMESMNIDYIPDINGDNKIGGRLHG